VILKLDAQLNKITTTIDGGWRVTFDLGDWAGPSLATLAEVRDHPLTLIVSNESIQLDHIEEPFKRN